MPLDTATTPKSWTPTTRAYLRRKNFREITGMTGRILSAVGYPSGVLRDVLCALQAVKREQQPDEPPDAPFYTTSRELGALMGKAKDADRAAPNAAIYALTKHREWQEESGIVLASVGGVTLPPLNPAAENSHPRKCLEVIDFITPIADSAWQRFLADPRNQAKETYQEAMSAAVAWAVEQLLHMDVPPPPDGADHARAWRNAVLVWQNPEDDALTVRVVGFPRRAEGGEQWEAEIEYNLSSDAESILRAWVPIDRLAAPVGEALPVSLSLDDALKTYIEQLTQTINRQLEAASAELRDKYHSPRSVLELHEFAAKAVNAALRKRTEQVAASWSLELRQANAGPAQRLEPLADDLAGYAAPQFIPSFYGNTNSAEFFDEKPDVGTPAQALLITENLSNGCAENTLPITENLSNAPDVAGLPITENLSNGCAVTTPLTNNLPLAENTFSVAADSFMLTAALYFAAQGYAVFPLHTPDETLACSCRKAHCASNGKHPRTANGLKDATQDAAQIRRWWQQWPDANIGIATGPASNLVVLDVDVHKGGADGLTELHQQFGDELMSWLESAPEVLTGGDGVTRGLQFYFTYDGADVPNSAGRLGPGLDVRGNGGYVVAPPSLHKTGLRYEWAKTPPVIPELPVALRALMLPPEPGAVVNASGARVPDYYPRQTIDDIGVVGEGQRNDVMFRKVACRARGAGKNFADVLAALENANRHCSPPLPRRELETIARSACRFPAGSVS